MLGPILVRRYVTLERLTANNEVAGFKFAVVGVLYAVLLAFAIIVVWEKFTDAGNIVAREAGAATNVYRLSYGMAEAPATSLRARLERLSRSHDLRRLAGHGAREREFVGAPGPRCRLWVGPCLLKRPRGAIALW